MSLLLHFELRSKSTGNVLSDGVGRFSLELLNEVLDKLVNTPGVLSEMPWLNSVNSQNQSANMRLSAIQIRVWIVKSIQSHL